MSDRHDNREALIVDLAERYSLCTGTSYSEAEHGIRQLIAEGDRFGMEDAMRQMAQVTALARLA